LAVVDASEGKVGSLIDTLLLFNCFQWDPEAGSFVPSAWKIMRLGAGISAIILFGGIFVLFRLERSGRGGRGSKNGQDSGPSGPALQSGGTKA
jgi:protein SCO1/2